MVTQQVLGVVEARAREPLGARHPISLPKHGLVGPIRDDPRVVRDLEPERVRPLQRPTVQRCIVLEGHPMTRPQAFGEAGQVRIGHPLR